MRLFARRFAGYELMLSVRAASQNARVDDSKPFSFRRNPAAKSLGV
jgi:hypothetical protein